MISEEDLKHFKAEADFLVKRAKESGIVLTIEQVPLQPLKMGNYETLVSVRPVTDR